MGFLDKVKNLVSQNADKVDSAIDKVGDVVDQKTQGKYSQHVDKVQEAAKKAVDNTQDNTQQPGQPPASPPAPPQP
jgi:phage terminase Nu1 subunit (DNA packaging protein)